MSVSEVIRHRNMVRAEGKRTMTLSDRVMDFVRASPGWADRDRRGPPPNVNQAARALAGRGLRWRQWVSQRGASDRSFEVCQTTPAHRRLGSRIACPTMSRANPGSDKTAAPSRSANSSRRSERDSSTTPLRLVLARRPSRVAITSLNKHVGPAGTYCRSSAGSSTRMSVPP